MKLKIQYPISGEGKCLIYNEDKTFHILAEPSMFDFDVGGGITLHDYLKVFLKVYVEGHVDDAGLLHIEDFLDEGEDW